MTVNDMELLILSWTQVEAMLLLGSDPDFEEAQADLLDKLSTGYDVKDLQIVARTYDEYTVSYVKGKETLLITFPSEEVDSIYDL